MKLFKQSTSGESVENPENATPKEKEKKPENVGLIALLAPLVASLVGGILWGLYQFAMSYGLYLIVGVVLVLVFQSLGELRRARLVANHKKERQTLKQEHDLEMFKQKIYAKNLLNSK